MNSFQLSRFDEDIAGALAAIEKVTNVKITIRTVTVVETESEHMDIVLRELLGGLVVYPETRAPDPAPALSAASPAAALFATVLATRQKGTWDATPKEKACEICGEVFTAIRANARICHNPECKAENNRRYQKALKEKKGGAKTASIDPLAITPPAPDPA